MLGHQAGLIEPLLLDVRARELGCPPAQRLVSLLVVAELGDLLVQAGERGAWPWREALLLDERL